MTARVFADTNILLYAGSQHPADAEKRKIALEILRLPDIGFSAQVMQEYFHVAFRKERLAITREEAFTALRAIARKAVAPITAELVLQAAKLSEHFGISYWDAAIIAAAQELGCEILYTEDLNHEQDYGGVQAINPFAGLSR